MKRNIQKTIESDLEKKIVLLSGPRQVGKTTLSKKIYNTYDYFNYDLAKDRVAIQDMRWDSSSIHCLIFDELHKMKKWKQWLKGVYDTQGVPPAILVTGSAQLNTYRKVGDSLAGRFFSHRLYPLDLKELELNKLVTASSLDQLMLVSGFPEPFLKNDLTFYKRWSKSHLDIMLRQDLIDLQSISDIKSIELLIELLRTRVGSGISYSNLAKDLSCDPTTVKRWLQLLEELYVVFKIQPYSGNIAKTIRKQPKYYFFDTALVEGSEGAKFENLVANALIKNLHIKEDSLGIRVGLYYLRTKAGNEVDFLVLQDKVPTHLIEVKVSDDSISPNLIYFNERLNPKPLNVIQIVKNSRKSYVRHDGIKIVQASNYLSNLEL